MREAKKEAERLCGLFKEQCKQFEYETGEYNYCLWLQKQCALICVDEIIKNSKKMDDKWHDNEDAPLTSVFIYNIDFYQEVKQELEKL